MKTGRPARAAEPRLPSDLGLPALGHLMRLAAIVATAIGAFVLGSLVIAGAPTETALLAAGLMLLGGYRAAAHHRAGRAVAARAPELTRAVRGYLVAALVSAVAMVPLLALLLHASVADAALVPLASLIWPAAVALLVFRARIREMFAVQAAFDVDVVPRDRSIEGMGILMTVFGALGVAIGLMLLVAAVERGGELFATSAAILFALAMTARSGIHLQWGVEATSAAASGTEPSVFALAVRRYRRAAMLSVLAFAVFVLVLAMGMSSAATSVLTIVCLGTALMAWPIIVGDFARAAATRPRGRAPAFGAAPDRGLTALGYLLVFVACLTLTLDLAAASFAVGPGRLFGAPSWLDALRLASMLWAGVELVRMTSRFVLATRVYALTSIAVTLVGWAQDGLPSFGGAAASFIVGVLQAVIAVVVPVLALLLVRREVPVESPARAVSIAPVPATAADDDGIVWKLD